MAAARALVAAGPAQTISWRGRGGGVGSTARAQRSLPGRPGGAGSIGRSIEGGPGPNEIGAHPGHHLAAAAQGRGGVIGGQEHRPVRTERVGLAPQLGDPPGGVEQQPGGEVAEGDDDPGTDQRQLLLQIGAAGRDLVGQGIAISRVAGT